MHGQKSKQILCCVDDGSPHAFVRVRPFVTPSLNDIGRTVRCFGSFTDESMSFSKYNERVFHAQRVFTAKQVFEMPNRWRLPFEHHVHVFNGRHQRVFFFDEVLKRRKILQ